MADIPDETARETLEQLLPANVWAITQNTPNRAKATAERHARTSSLEGEAEIYPRAVKTLGEGLSTEVLVYAPTGLWDVPNRATDPYAPMTPKENWFEALANELRANKDLELRAVFGVPDSKSFGDTDEVDRFGAFESQVRRFEGLCNASLRFMPPPGSPFQRMQGFGVVVFKDFAGGIGFAVAGHHTTVDHALFVRSPADVDMLESWFDKSWGRLGDYILHQDRAPHVGMEAGLASARSSFDAAVRDYRGRLD